MPNQFDDYKLMDRGATKNFADAGGKEAIKNILIAAVKNEASRIATALLIRDLLNFKVAQATDKKNTTDPERWLKILPTHIAAVSKLGPTNHKGVKLLNDLNEANLRLFIANSSSVFQRQIPGTFKALLDVVIILPDVKSRLVDSYTAKFLKSNGVAGITDADVLNVGTRKRPTAVEIKKFFEQLCLLPDESIYGTMPGFFKVFDDMKPLLSDKFLQCLVDWPRLIPYNPLIGHTVDQGWNIHVFKVLEFVEKVEKHSPYAVLKDMIRLDPFMRLWKLVSIGGLRSGQLPTIKIFDRFKNLREPPKLIEPPNGRNLTEPPSASWLVFLSGSQGIYGAVQCWVVNQFYCMGGAYGKGEKSRVGIDQTSIKNLENSNVVCELPGGWMDMQYMQIRSRYVTPLRYDLSKKSFKLYFAFELYWVPQGIKERNYNAEVTDDVGNDEKISFSSQGSWWVSLTHDIEFLITPHSITLKPKTMYWEVFDTKPRFPRVKWPNP